MSALSARAPLSAVQYDGLRRFNTRIKAIVHSHQSEDPIVLSQDVVSCQTGKNIGGIGRANLALTASKNYTNLLYPNDVLNIYFDIGDGQGYTRTFFGYIDRIEEEYTVAENGVPSTMYHVIASDWQKAIDKTEIYFNPDLAGRTDINGSDFATISLGGLSMHMRGLRLTGSPADMVLNLLLLQLGYGTQWIFPNSYRVTLDNRVTSARKEYAMGRLLRTMRNKITLEQQTRLEELIESGDLLRLQQQAQDDATNASDAAQRRALLSQEGVNTTNLPTDLRQSVNNPQSTNDIDAVANVLFNRRVRNELGITEDQLAEVNTAYNAIGAIVEGTSLLDIVDLIDFVEIKAMDGFAFEAGIWERQGPLGTIVKSVSNETINELFYDLRPLCGETGMEDGSHWDRTLDELGGNAPDDYSQQNGVRYIPAVVMREQPFGTVHKIDATQVDVGLRRDGATANFGVVNIGAVFSSRPNEAGRHIINVPVIAVEDLLEGNTSAITTRHIDVAVISETEIKSSRLGRSDNDHFNMFDFFSEDVLGSANRFLVKDFLPIITPIHIMRHGLRVRQVTTRFARFDTDQAANTTVAPSQAIADREQDAAQTDDPQNADNLSTDVVPPVGVPPAGYALRFTNSYGSDYGYRRDQGGRGSLYWHFHNGIDIGMSPRESEVIDIVAIADGYVVASIPGTPRLSGFGGYGDYVAIEHPQLSHNGQKVFSIYAHLSSRAALTGNPNGSIRHVDCIAKGYHPRTANRSNFQRRRVNKGEVIGKMGRTGISGTSKEHLHFEMAVKFPTKSTVTSDIATSVDNRTIRIEQLRSQGYSNPESYVSTVVSPVEVRPPTPESDKSLDPYLFFQAQGVDLIAAIRDLNGGTSSAEEIDETEGGGEQPITPDDDAPQTETTETPTDAQDQARSQNQGVVGSVDSVTTRRQLGRWALLQDHWFQHNLEYLSGQIQMRGAPEIRVGYRLDIIERRMSFYVEGVNHSWQFPNEMTTTLQVTRGQSNDPYPAYALPPTPGFNTTDNARRRTSRLAQYSIVPDPVAVRSAIVLRTADNLSQTELAVGASNFIDMPSNWGTPPYNFGELPQGYQPGQQAQGLVPADVSDDATAELDAEIQDLLDLIDERLNATTEESASTATVDGERADVSSTVANNTNPTQEE